MRRKRVDAGLSKDERAARREQLTPRVVELRKQGKTWVEISAELDAPRTTLQKWFRPPSAPKPKPAKPKPAPAGRVEMTPALASRVMVMHGAGMATWTIAKRANTTAHDVERVIARSKLESMVRDGRLTIRQASAAEMEEFARQRAAHDRKALQERDRQTAATEKAAAQHDSEISTGHTGRIQRDDESTPPSRRDLAAGGRR